MSFSQDAPVPMSLSETSKLTCLEGWKDTLKIREWKRANQNHTTPSSKFNVQIAQISKCFWQHCPRYIALTLSKDRQSILGVLFSERRGRYGSRFRF